MFNFRIYNWMSKSLNLKKFTLLIYAYVYSFTNHEGGFFECTIETISKNLGISRNSVGTALKYLSDNNFLIKTTYTYKNLKRVKYMHNRDIASKAIAECEGNTKHNAMAYITIYDWMVTEYHLSGHELITYALIYSFSNSQKQYYQGTLDYICNRFNLDIRTAYRVINNLESKNMITLYGKGRKEKVYRTNFDYTPDNDIISEYDDFEETFETNNSEKKNNCQKSDFDDIDAILQREIEQETKQNETEKNSSLDTEKAVESEPDYEKDLQLLENSIAYFCDTHGVNLDELAYMLEEDYINRSRLHKVIELVKDRQQKELISEKKKVDKKKIVANRNMRRMLAKSRRKAC